MTSNTSLIAARIIAVLSAVFISLMSSCKTSQTSCVTAPISSHISDSTNLVTLAAKLDKLKINASNTNDFSRLVVQNYATLNDKNAALLLFLSAIDCYLQKGVVGEEIARNMSRIVLENWSTAQGLSGSPAKLTAIQKSLIAQHPQSKEIIHLLSARGIE